MKATVVSSNDIQDIEPEVISSFVKQILKQSWYSSQSSFWRPETAISLMRAVLPSMTNTLSVTAGQEEKKNDKDNDKYQNNQKYDDKFKDNHALHKHFHKLQIKIFVCTFGQWLKHSNTLIHLNDILSLLIADAPRLECGILEVERTIGCIPWHLPKASSPILILHHSCDDNPNIVFRRLFNFLIP